VSPRAWDVRSAARRSTGFVASVEFLHRVNGNNNAERTLFVQGKLIEWQVVRKAYARHAGQLITFSQTLVEIDRCNWRWYTKITVRLQNKTTP